MKHPSSFAIIGGGLAGMSTAYQILRTRPGAQVVVFEKADDASYDPSTDSSHRASLGASGARTIRLSGAVGELPQSLVLETKAMLDGLKADMANNPSAYGDLANVPLIRPEATVTIAPDRNDAQYQKALKSLSTAGVRYEEISGAQLKAHYPGLYKQAPDGAAVLRELPAGAENPHGVAGVMDTPVILKAMRRFIERHGGQVRTNDAVSQVRDTGDGVEVLTSRGTTAAFDRAILSPGQWVNTLVDTAALGIETRLDRVIMLDVDLKGLGITSNGIPFTKGLAPEAGKVSFYSFQPNPASGHAKFIVAGATRSVESIEALHQPATPEEQQKAWKAVSATLGVPEEEVAKHSRTYTCAYTSPRVKENPIVAHISQNVVLNGLDSSSTARTCGGLGNIAASLALELGEPYRGAYDKFSLQAHRDLVKTAPVIEQDAVVQQVVAAVRTALGVK